MSSEPPDIDLSKVHPHNSLFDFHALSESRSRLVFPSARVQRLESQFAMENPEQGSSMSQNLTPALGHDFQAVVQLNPTDNTKWQCGVVLKSRLYGSRDYTDLKTINNLLTADFPGTGDAGWLSVLPGASLASPDVVWLEYDLSNASANIRNLGGLDTFDGGEVEHDGGMGAAPVLYTQTYARKVLALIYYTTNSPDVGIVIDQRVYTPLVLLNSPQTAKKSDGTTPKLVASIYPEAL